LKGFNDVEKNSNPFHIALGYSYRAIGLSNKRRLTQKKKITNTILRPNAIPGEPKPPLDVTLCTVAGIVVTLVGIGVAIATKGKLGYPTESS